MNKHFIFDFETFGQDISDCAVINCAYYTFDFDKFLTDEPYTFDFLIKDISLAKLNVEDQVVRFDYKIYKSSIVEFWSKLPKEAQDQIKPCTNDITLEQFFDDLLCHFSHGKPKYWWSRSNTFDPIILMRMAKSVKQLKNLENILKFWTVRDTRTYIDACTGFGANNNFNPLAKEECYKFIAHNAIHDVAIDIMRLQYCERNSREIE